jgi:metal-responsive CopG/Arc/MetJ family transcriptional regulator
MKKITVEMEDELLMRLKLVAVKESKKMSEIVRGLVSAYVTRKEGEGV